MCSDGSWMGAGVCSVPSMTSFGQNFATRLSTSSTRPYAIMIAKISDRLFPAKAGGSVSWSRPGAFHIGSSGS